jgi:hypothetical protein
LISIAIVVLGLLDLVLAATEVLRPQFVIVLLLTLFIHLVGAPIESPGCFVPFLAPTAAIIVLGVYEIMCPRKSEPAMLTPTDSPT